MMEKSFKHPDFPQDFVGSVYELWRNGKLCDASIEVGSRVFKFHKIVFAASSPEFLNMDETRLVIQLPVDTDISALEALLQYVYGGELKLTQSNVESVQKLATMFNINKVLEFCEKFQSDLIDKAENLKTKTVSRESHDSYKERNPVKRSCRLKAGKKSSRGRSRSKNLQIDLPIEVELVQESCIDIGMESTCVFPTRGILPTKGKGKGKASRMNRGGKSLAPSLLRACTLKSGFENESSVKEEKVLKLSTLNDSLRKSPRNRNAKTKLQSDTLASVVKLEFEKASQSNEQTEKHTLKEELDSIDNPSKHNPNKKRQQTGKHRPLTRAEIQRAYRARKLEKMSPSELEAFKTKERARARKNWSSKSVLSVSPDRGQGRGQGRGKKKKVKVTKKGKDQSKATVKEEVEAISTEPTPSKLEGQDRKAPQRNNRQKRYRDRMRNDPEWRRKEAERSRKRYIPVSQLTKKEHKLRRMRESERTRMWRLKKKLQKSSLPMVNEDQSMADISGQSFISRNMHESFCGESGHDIGRNNELVHPDVCMVLVNSVIHSLDDQYQYMFAGDGNQASEIVKREAIDPDYLKGENVAFVESITSGNSTGNNLHPNVDTPETGFCNSKMNEIDKVDIDTGDNCLTSNFRIKTEDGDVIISEADHESIGNVKDCDDDSDDKNDQCIYNVIHVETGIDNVTHVGKEEPDMVRDGGDH